MYACERSRFSGLNIEDLKKHKEHYALEISCFEPGKTREKELVVLDLVSVSIGSCA